MGLGLYVKAVRAGRSWTRLFNQAGNLSQELARQLLKEIADPTLRAMAAIHAVENGVDVELHPAAEYLEIRDEGLGACICSIKTSTCGPGFHAYVVELLERAGTKLDLHWTLDGDYADETGFWTERSFEHLQRDMAHILYEIARSIAERGGNDEDVMINMPIGFPALADGGKHIILTPIGPKTSEWFELVARSPDEAWRLAPGFFPWWGRGQGSDFWRGLGLVLAWCEISWAAPSSDTERSSCELALRSLRQAATAGAHGLPMDEIAEIESLLAARELPPPDAFPVRIGYRRRRQWRPLTGRWQVALPGYFYSDVENDGDTAVYWHDTRTVRGSSYSISRRDGTVASATDMVGEPKVPDDGAAELLDERESDPPRWATILWKEDGDGEYWKLSGMTGAPNQLCICTICFDDEIDRQWALDTWRSVRHQADSQGR